MMGRRWVPTISRASPQQLVMIRVAQWQLGNFLLGLAWDHGITTLDISTTIMGELVFTGEDHSNLPLDFNLAKGVSLLSDSLGVSEVVVVRSCGRGSFLAGFGRYFQEFTREVHEIGFLVEQRLEELVEISHYRDALLIGSMQRASSVYSLLVSEWNERCLMMTRMVWDLGIHLDQLVERQHAMALLEGKQFWGGETITSPNFGLLGKVVRRVFQSLCQPSHRSRITPLVGPRGFRGVLWAKLGSLVSFW